MCNIDNNLPKQLLDIYHRLERLEKYIQHVPSPAPTAISVSRVYTTSERNLFETAFNQQYPHFIPQLRILVNNLTSGEEQLCMMIKLNMNNREMARMLNIDIKSVYTARSRMKRKIVMDKDVTMDDWIKNIPYAELKL